MRRTIQFAALALALALTATPARSDNSNRAGEWTIQRYEHVCAALRRDEHGTVLTFTFYTEKSGKDLMALFLANDKWQVPSGSSYPVTVTIDAMYTARATAQGLADNAVEIDLPMNEAFQPFVNGKTLTVAGPKSSVVTNLVDMTQAAGAVIDCFKQLIDSKSSRNPFQP